jgi:glycogen synthase
MRVLMFGWEFPPHISGGLGTACFGLTQSLVQENVSLIFVVPKLFGNEPGDKMELVNASDVFIPLAHQTAKSITRKYRQGISVGEAPEEGSHSKGMKEKPGISYIEVNASLNPYGMVSDREKQLSIKNWNYVFDAGAKNQTGQNPQKNIESSEQEKPAGYTYDFSGSYGSNLMEEVQQYAFVGAELAKKFPHDVIHAHDWMTYAAGIQAKKISGKPLVVHVHATEYDRSGYLGGPVFDFEKTGMEAADKIVSVSQWTKDIIVSKYGIAPEKIEVVHNGITAAEESTSFEEPPVGSHMVTFLGRVTQQKGPAYFVEAAKKVSEKFPDAHFIVAGAGDLLPQTIERVAQLRMSDRFHFTGFLNKEWISKIWSMSNVYVMPSVSEPFGITPLEAIQAGVPVIVSNQSGVAEVMPHALKVNFWDTEALAESICSILKYKSLSSMMKSHGEKEVKRLSWRNAAVKIKTLYEEIAPTLCQKAPGVILSGAPATPAKKIQIL